MGKCAFAISLLGKNTIIKSGESFEIECYLTGYGEPSKNKLQVYVSTEGFIDKKNPGYIEVSGRTEGKWFKFGSKYKSKHEFQEVGVQIGLASSFFKTRDDFQKKTGKTPKGLIPMIMTETMVDSTPPLLLHLNTDKNTEAGDYYVHFIFTYSTDGNEYFISDEKSKIHITNWVERNITKLQWLGVSIGVIAFISSVIQTYYTYLQYIG